MKLNKHVFGVLLAMAAVSLAAQADDFLSDPVIARGTGVEIKQSRLDEAIASYKAGAITRGQQFTPEQMPLLQKTVFDKLLFNQLLIAKATDAEKAAGKEDGDKRFELVKKRAPSPEVLAKQLKAIPMTLDQLHTRLIEEAVSEAVMRSKASVTDDQAKKYYEDHPGDFEEPEMVRAQHILMIIADPKTGAPLSADEKKAKLLRMEDILKRARAGEDFSKLAREYSEDGRAKETGGESTFPRESVPLEFGAAAFSMKTNQISDVVTTSLGYHIIKVIEKIPAKKYDLAKVNSDIKDYLARKEMDDRAPALYQKLREEAKVEILDSRLKDLDAASAPPASAAPLK